MTKYISRLIFVIAFAVARLSLAGNDTVNVEEVVRDTEHFLEELNTYEELSLAVMIAKDGVPVLETTYGLANRSFAVPNRVDTKFNLASMNKMFTAVAIMQLVQQGKLDLDGTVGDYVPDYPNDEVKNSVSIYQLLTHTAGMGNIFGPLYNQTPVNRFQTVDDYLPLFIDDPVRFAPGSKYEYSNAGYILLGYLIERITGRDYHAYVKDNIFIPAGMNDTDCYDVQYPVPNLAIGYSRSKARSQEYEYKTIEFMKMTKGGPAGGGYSTVGDLTKFGEALFGNRLLNEKYTDLTTTGKIPVDDIWQGGEYGFGFLEQVINGHRIVGHSGNFAGIRSTLKIYPNEGLSIAILSNFDRDQGAEELEYYIRERINGETDFTRSYLQTKRIIRTVELEGYSVAAKEYEQIRGEVRLYEGLINTRGYFLLGKRKYEQAIDLFAFNVFAFPGSGNAHDSLAEAYMTIGDNENAIKHYRKALEIDPSLESATEALEKLGASY
jgi:CubicO group peptidase (beta-lactamase class C family)